VFDELGEGDGGGSGKKEGAGGCARSVTGVPLVGRDGGQLVLTATSAVVVGRRRPDADIVTLSLCRRRAADGGSTSST